MGVEIIMWKFGAMRIIGGYVVCNQIATRIFRRVRYYDAMLWSKRCGKRSWTERLTVDLSQQSRKQLLRLTLTNTRACCKETLRATFCTSSNSLLQVFLTEQTCGSPSDDLCHFSCNGPSPTSPLSWVNLCLSSEVCSLQFTLLELPDVTLWKRMTSLGFEPRTFPIRGDALTTELSGLV